MEVPKIRVGPGLSQTSSNTEQTSYVVVIQGRTGARKAKVFIHTDLDQAAATMLHEALNGYSTVFSAAYFPRQQGTLSKLSVGPQNAVFRKVARGQALPTAAI